MSNGIVKRGVLMCPGCHELIPINSYPIEVQAVLTAAKRLKVAAAATLPDESYFIQYCRDVVSAYNDYEKMEKKE